MTDLLLDTDSAAEVRSDVRDDFDDRDNLADDHFIVRDGIRCAGTHLIIDLYGCDRLADREHIDATLRAAVDVAGATLLHIHLHCFEPNGGISGVAVLAESHISIHTWPENGYAALDVFMCGRAKPDRCIPLLAEAFAATEVAVRDLLRGERVHHPAT